MCANTAGYFVFGGEDTANQATSHMKGSGGSVNSLCLDLAVLLRGGAAGGGTPEAS